MHQPGVHLGISQVTVMLNYISFLVRENRLAIRGGRCWGSVSGGTCSLGLELLDGRLQHFDVHVCGEVVHLGGLALAVLDAVVGPRVNLPKQMTIIIMIKYKVQSAQKYMNCIFSKAPNKCLSVNILSKCFYLLSKHFYKSFPVWLLTRTESRFW